MVLPYFCSKICDVNKVHIMAEKLPPCNSDFNILRSLSRRELTFNVEAKTLIYSLRKLASLKFRE